MPYSEPPASDVRHSAAWWIARTPAGAPAEVHVGPTLPASTAAQWQAAGLTWAVESAAAWVEPVEAEAPLSLFGGPHGVD